MIDIEELAYEDFHGISRPANHAYVCQKCGANIITRSVYFSHVENCEGKPQIISQLQIRRDIEQNKSLEQFHRKHGITPQLKQYIRTLR